VVGVLSLFVLKEMRERFQDLQESARFAAEKLHYLERSPLFLQFRN